MLTVGDLLARLHEREKEIQDLKYRVQDLESQLGASQKRKCCWCGHVFPAKEPISCPHCNHPMSEDALQAGISYEPNWPWR